jgi:hypothetical protein
MFRNVASFNKNVFTITHYTGFDPKSACSTMGEREFVEWMREISVYPFLFLQP